MHCSRRRLLRRRVEFHVCTINKSAHTKSLETYLMILVYKLAGFFPRGSRPEEHEKTAATRFHALWALTLSQTVQNVSFGSDVVLPTENLIKKWKGTVIMQSLEVTLCQTHWDKEAKRNRDGLNFQIDRWEMGEKAARESVSRFLEALSHWPYTRLLWIYKPEKKKRP